MVKTYSYGTAAFADPHEISSQSASGPMADVGMAAYGVLMTPRFFTFVSEFRGTTALSQVVASDEREAVIVWAECIEAEKPFGRASTYLARSAARGDTCFEPVGISGLASVWCVTGICGGDLLLADIVETVLPPSGH